MLFSCSLPRTNLDAGNLIYRSRSGLAHPSQSLRPNKLNSELRSIQEVKVFALLAPEKCLGSGPANSVEQGHGHATAGRQCSHGGF